VYPESRKESGKSKGWEQFVNGWRSEKPGMVMKVVERTLV